MIKPFYKVFPIAVVLAACSAASDAGSEKNEYAQLELAATGKLQCAWENQQRCAHLIDRRTTFAKIFAPEVLSGLDPQKRLDGRNATTRFIVEATAGINQCRRVDMKSIPIVKDVKIAGETYRVEGTIPLSASSSCFLITDPENT